MRRRDLPRERCAGSSASARGVDGHRGGAQRLRTSGRLVRSGSRREGHGGRAVSRGLHPRAEDHEDREGRGDARNARRWQRRRRAAGQSPRDIVPSRAHARRSVPSSLPLARTRVMPARRATPFDAPRISALLERSLRAPEAVLASALPVPFAAGAVSGVGGLALGVAGITGRRLHVFLEQYRGQLRSAALVYDGRRPEWVVLLLAAMFEPGGVESAFRLLSGISAAAARAGMHRLFAAVPDEARARETFFQAGFYSYTRGTWPPPTRMQLIEPRRVSARRRGSVECGRLLPFYCAA